MLRRRRRAEFFFETRVGSITAGFGTFVIGQFADDAWGHTVPLVWKWIRGMF